MYSTHNVIALKKKQDNNYGRTTVPDGGKERRLNAANQYTLLLHSIVVNDNLMHFFLQSLVFCINDTTLHLQRLVFCINDTTLQVATYLSSICRLYVFAI